MHFIYTNFFQLQSFLINCFRFANAINDNTIINIFNSDDSNIADIDTTYTNHDSHYKHNLEI